MTFTSETRYELSAQCSRCDHIAVRECGEGENGGPYAYLEGKLNAAGWRHGLDTLCPACAESYHKWLGAGS